MKSLQTIQKTFRIFQNLTKMAYIFCIVGASVCAVGVLCVMMWYTKGEVISFFGKPVIMFVGSESQSQMLAVLLSEMVFLITDAVLLGFVNYYLKIEQAEGTPFTKNGANLIKKIGIRCIYMPIVATIIASVIMDCFDVQKNFDFSNFSSVATGIALILISFVFCYGAELEQRIHSLERNDQE